MLTDSERITGNGDRPCLLDLSPALVRGLDGEDRPCLLDLPAFALRRAKRDSGGSLVRSGIRPR